VLTFYAPPLVVARLLGAFARNAPMSADDLAPYVLSFAGLWTQDKSRGAWRSR
jgi:hypothetical protein